MKNRTASLLVDSDLVCECPNRNKGESDCQFNRRLRRHGDQMPSPSQEGECRFTCRLEPFDGMPNARNVSATRSSCLKSVPKEMCGIITELSGLQNNHGQQISSYIYRVL